MCVSLWPTSFPHSISFVIPSRLSQWGLWPGLRRTSSLLTILALCGWVTLSSAHPYDQEGCEELLLPQWAELLYAGVSENGLDFVTRWQFLTHKGVVETHTPLAPQAQWEDKLVPEPLPVQPTAYHLDLDGDGVYEHIFLAGPPGSGCDKMIHRRWSPTLRQYEIVLGGKDHL